MKYGSVCSGVEAASVAWSHLNWEPQWFSEIDKFPSAVLNHRFPSVPNLGDMTNYKEWPDEPIDLLVGGTPCQSFSVAGLRKGLDDPRGNLMLTYLGIADRYKPKWLVWENVPGVLSSNKGRDFGTFLAALGQIGYGFAYRVLDAQYFGVAQRRRRVFIVGYLGDWRRAAAVLFERESMSGHPATSRETRQEIAPTVTSGAPFSRTGNQRVEADALVAKCLTTRTGSAYDPTTETLPIGWSEELNALTDLQPTIQRGGAGGRHEGVMLPIAFGAQNSSSQGDSVSEHVTPTLDKSKTPAICAPLNTQLGLRGAETSNTRREGVGIGTDGDPSFTLQAAHSHAVITPTQVRRLTPIECERLQGFPDNYTQIAWRNKMPENCPDGPRYKAMGNSMAVPVMHWIGKRIQMVEEIQ